MEDGVAEVDLLAGTLAWQGTTRWVEPWDRFLSDWRRGGGLRRQAAGALLAYGRHALRLGRRSDPFFEGMRESIAAFHRRLDRGEVPADGQAAAETIEWCEAIWAGRRGAGVFALRDRVSWIAVVLTGALVLLATLNWG